LLADLDIVLVTEVTVPRLNVVTSEMLASCRHSSGLGILTTLKSKNQGVDVRRQMVSVLSRSFYVNQHNVPRSENVSNSRTLSSAPSGVSVRVDVGSPEIKSGTTVVVEGSRLGTHNLANGSDERIIESRTHDDRLRKGGRIAKVSRVEEADTRRLSYTMESLVPPLVFGQTKSWDSRAAVTSEVQLLGRGQDTDQSFGSHDWVWRLLEDMSAVRWNMSKLTC
jgi:hypothetical protein